MVERLLKGEEKEATAVREWRWWVWNVAEGIHKRWTKTSHLEDNKKKQQIKRRKLETQKWEEKSTIARIAGQNPT